MKNKNKSEDLKIWVDADACPKTIKDILFRAAERRQIEMTLVANQPLKIPPSKVIKTVQVGAGFDVADNYIVLHMHAGDLVVTADIPLADEVIDKEGYALNPRGEFYTKENIKQRLSMRNFMDELRGSGVDTGGPGAFSQSNRKEFSDQLDRFLTKRSR